MPRLLLLLATALAAAAVVVQGFIIFSQPMRPGPAAQVYTRPLRPLPTLALMPRLQAAGAAAAAEDVGGGAHVVGEVLPEREPTLKVTRVSVEDAAANICGYRVEAEIHGPDVKRTFEVAKKGAAINANYKGFRKGVVPPQALLDVKINTVTAAIMDVCRQAMELHGLANFAINERPLRMKEPPSMEALAKSYEVGKDLRFVCEIDAIGIPGEPKAPPSQEEETAAAAAAAATPEASS